MCLVCISNSKGASVAGCNGREREWRRLGQRYRPRSDHLGLGAMMRISDFVLSAMGNYQRVENNNIICFYSGCCVENKLNRRPRSKKEDSIEGGGLDEGGGGGRSGWILYIYDYGIG